MFCEENKSVLHGCNYFKFSARLDGTSEKVKKHLASHSTIEDWLETGEDFNKPVEEGKKRVIKSSLVHVCKIV